MIVRRPKLIKDPEGVTVTQEFAISPKMSIAAKGLYVYLLAMKDPTYVTVIGISLGLRERGENIWPAMKELVALGLVEGAR